jgi:hypothetical protein
MEVSGQLHVSAALSLWIGGWVGVRVGLNAVTKRKNLNPWREPKPDSPTSSLVTNLGIFLVGKFDGA